MEREYQHYDAGQSAVLTELEDGLFSVKIWREDELVCDVVTDQQQADLLLAGFEEIDPDNSFYDLGGSD